MFRPNLGVGVSGFLPARTQDDAAQDRLPGDRRDLNHTTVGKELGEISADRLRIRRVRRAQVDQQHTDLWAWDIGMVVRALHQAAIKSNGRSRKRRPIPEANAFATAAAQTTWPSPLTPPGASRLATNSISIFGMGPSRLK